MDSLIRAQFAPRVAAKTLHLVDAISRTHFNRRRWEFISVRREEVVASELLA
jgi:hypothetical protein